MTLDELRQIASCAVIEGETPIEVKGVPFSKVILAIAALPDLIAAVEALAMVREDDNDARLDGRMTIPPVLRSKIDAILSRLGVE